MHTRADGSGGRLQVRSREQANCLPSEHGQGTARRPTLRTRGPSSLQGWWTSQVIGGPTALEAVRRSDPGNRPAVAGRFRVQTEAWSKSRLRSGSETQVRSIRWRSGDQVPRSRKNRNPAPCTTGTERLVTADSRLWTALLCHCQNPKILFRCSPGSAGVV